MKKIFQSLAILLSIVLILAALIVPQTAYGANYMTMRNITAYNLVAEMNVGINIGDTLDSSFGHGETYWGNPAITKNLILAYKNAGFNTIRLPVTWDGSINSSTGVPNEQWLTRVNQVVDWILEEDMFCIVNTHHEMSWLNTSDTGMSERKTKFGNLWTAIANRFKNYGDHLLFEGYNEMRKTENTWNASGNDYQNLNQLAQVFVNSVRATGSNNSSRTLIISTYAANFDTNGFILPTDTASNRIAVEFHSYYPQNFCFTWGNQTTFGSQSDISTINSFCSKFSQYIEANIPVILGEFGAVNKSNDSARAAYAQKVVETCNSYGIKGIWWDNGKVTSSNGGDAFALIDRSTCQVAKQGIISALVNTANTQAPTTVPASNANGNYTFEAENLNRTTNGTIETFVATNDYNCGTNKFIALCTSNPTSGKYVEFTIPSVQAGTYNLLVPTRATPTRSKFNISVNGTTTASNVNFAYSSGASGFVADYVTINCGNLTIASNQTSNVKIRFTISSAGNSGCYIDKIKLNRSSGSSTNTTTTTSATNSYTFEAENLTRTTNGSVGIFTATNDYNCGTNKFVTLCSSNPTSGKYVEFTLNSVQAGTYTLSVPTRATPTRSKFNISVNGTTTASNVNFAYSSGASGFIADYVTISCGNITVSSTSNVKLRFTISSAGNSGCYIDKIKLTRNSVPKNYTFEAESVSRSTNGSVGIFNATNDYNCGTNSFVVLCSSNPTSGKYVEFTLNSVQAGTYTLSVPTRATPTRSKFNITVNGTTVASNVNFAYTNGNSNFIADYITINCGTFTVNSTSNVKVRFTISTAGTSGCYIDKIKLTGM